jgi:polar amino acid transport system substrate-binding protein
VLAKPLARTRAVLVAGGLLASVGLIAGCGATPSAGGHSAAQPGAAARALVPQDMRRSGVLTVGTDLNMEPMEFLKDGQPAGFDIDLAQAIADRLGLRLEVKQTPWGELLPNVNTKSLDLALGSITDKAVRQEQVTFVDYLHVGSSVLVRNEVRDVLRLADLCGLRVAAQKDTMYQDMIEALVPKCPADKPLTPVIVDVLPREPVVAGQADAYLNDYPVAVADQAVGGLRITGQQLEAAPYGIAVNKERTDLVKAVQTALYDLFDDGTYDKLIGKWNLTEGSLKTGAINGGA